MNFGSAARCLNHFIHFPFVVVNFAYRLLCTTSDQVFNCCANKYLLTAKSNVEEITRDRFRSIKSSFIKISRYAIKVHLRKANHISYYSASNNLIGKEIYDKATKKICPLMPPFPKFGGGALKYLLLPNSFQCFFISSFSVPFPVNILVNIFVV